MKKIIFVVNTNSYSGAEAVNISIIENLKDRYEFYYASPAGPINEYLNEKNIKHVPIKKVSRKEINRIIEEYKPDILHATDFTASCVCATCKKKNLKVISHIHCNPLWLKRKLSLKSLFYLICSKKMDKILTVSNSVEEDYVYSKYIKNKIDNISNPVSVEMVRNKVLDYSKEYDLCYCGRLAEEKNPLGFIEIVNLLKRDIPTIKTVVVGAGNLEKNCNDKINELGLKMNVDMVGFKKNPYEYIAKSKMLVSTSIYEGYGLVAFEALALGVPVVAPCVGGISEVIVENCGCVYSNKLEAIEFIKQNLGKYKEFEKAAMIRATELDNLKKYMASLECLYKI